MEITWKERLCSVFWATILGVFLTLSPLPMPRVLRVDRVAKSSLKRSGRSIKLRWAPPGRVPARFPAMDGTNWSKKTRGICLNAWKIITFSIFTVVYHWLFHIKQHMRLKKTWKSRLMDTKQMNLQVFQALFDHWEDPTPFGGLVLLLQILMPALCLRCSGIRYPPVVERGNGKSRKMKACAGKSCNNPKPWLCMSYKRYNVVKTIINHPFGDGL